MVGTFLYVGTYNIDFVRRSVLRINFAFQIFRACLRRINYQKAFRLLEAVQYTQGRMRAVQDRRFAKRFQVPFAPQQSRKKAF
jgi:hypothetical protein